MSKICLRIKGLDSGYHEEEVDTSIDTLNSLIDGISTWCQANNHPSLVFYLLLKVSDNGETATYKFRSAGLSYSWDRVFVI